MTHRPRRSGSPTTRPSRLGAAALACAALWLGTPVVMAADWPTKPITVVVNVPVGGSLDAVTRAISAPLQDALGQTVIVDNRTGAAGNIGAELVTNAAPDGYTLLMTPTSVLTVNPAIYPQMRFDPMRDLTPVASAANIVSLLVVRDGLPAKDVPELVALAKAQPGKLTYASPGAGSIPHLAGEIFKNQSGVDVLHVPYRGASPALQDVLAGEVDYLFDAGPAIAHLDAGKIRLLAVGMPQRSALFPNTPTLDELGLTGFDGSTVYGFFAPAGTPEAVLERLNTEINKILQAAGTAPQFAPLGAEPLPMTRAEFSQQLEQSAERLQAVVKSQGIRLE